MTAGKEEDAWEWEDDALASSASSPASSDVRDHQEETQTHTDMPYSSLSDDSKWRFDLSELELEMARGLPLASASSFSVVEGATRTEQTLIASTDAMTTRLRSDNERVRTLQALALVVRLHVLSARGSCAELASGLEPPVDVITDIYEELRQLAGDWGNKELLETTLRPPRRQQLEEMTGLLHHALTADDEDLTLLQHVLEQLFRGLTDQTLVLSTKWLEQSADEDREAETETTSYLTQILALNESHRDGTSSALTLSEAEVFQDAKDIGRDELLINGVRVEGTREYDAVVEALQRELELVLARQAGKTVEQTSVDVNNALQSIAMAVLHAINRTESGGSSYELLSKFVSSHEVDRVLLRPNSARAAPLEVCVDVGPYLESIPGRDISTWAFGLRVKLVAVTWYLICDAQDPTKELHEFETTFCNRLAFPVGLTPFHPLECIRKDRGDVAVRLVLPTEDSSCSQSSPLRHHLDEQARA
ncbi:unnamed protein product [Hyaloperonospora brassicae]|uniref:Uncharacterized protein n=1 Tax=Hyaloperonospora brassicae TaxID=162125 RepID=A0AAV0T4P2_HYABA|nr:unnamed protein product [Hyaloperonospora brassicae]